MFSTKLSTAHCDRLCTQSIIARHTFPKSGDRVWKLLREKQASQAPRVSAVSITVYHFFVVNIYHTVILS